MKLRDLQGRIVRDEYDRLPADSFLAGKPVKQRRHTRGRWKTRKNPEYEAYIDSPKWKAFRLAILAARGRACEKCGTLRDGVRHIHHLHYRNFGNEKPEDVQVLCEPCHEKVEKNKRRKRAREAKRKGRAA